MDIMSIIEEYVNLTRLRAQIKKSRGQYVGSAPFLRQLPHLDTVDAAIDEEDELAVVLDKMNDTYKRYEEVLEAMDLNTMRSVCVQVGAKFAELKEQSDRLAKHKDWASREETVAFNANNAVAEERYDRICTSCTQTLTEIRQVLPYYKYFETDMMVRTARLAETKKQK